jgi:hypothetical protein
VITRGKLSLEMKNRKTGELVDPLEVETIDVGELCVHACIFWQVEWQISHRRTTYRIASHFCFEEDAIACAEELNRNFDFAFNCSEQRGNTRFTDEQMNVMRTIVILHGGSMRQELPEPEEIES